MLDWSKQLSRWPKRPHELITRHALDRIRVKITNIHKKKSHKNTEPKWEQISAVLCLQNDVLLIFASRGDFNASWLFFMKLKASEPQREREKELISSFSTGKCVQLTQKCPKTKVLAISVPVCRKYHKLWERVFARRKLNLIATKHRFLCKQRWQNENEEVALFKVEFIIYVLFGSVVHKTLQFALRKTRILYRNEIV